MPRSAHTVSILSFLLLPIAQALSPTSSPAQSIRFLREEIQISVIGERCEVIGEYHFRNESPETTAHQVVYPFPRQADMPEPASVEVEETSTRSRLNVTRIPHSALFWIALPPHGERSFRVRYAQPTPSRRMRYILRSTRSWGRPLDRATFTLLLPRRCTLASISIPPDTSWETENGMTYFLQKQNFMPVRDLTFRWNEGKLR